MFARCLTTVFSRSTSRFGPSPQPSPRKRYAVEKTGETRGWSFPVFEELWNYGFPQEMEHFVECVRTGKTPRENGHDGHAVLEAICALYASAGQRKRVELPFECNAARPIDLWGPRAAPGSVAFERSPVYIQGRQVYGARGIHDVIRSHG
jgi:Oxidoreductase family, C-terminal alpha/beta domain